MVVDLGEGDLIHVDAGAKRVHGLGGITHPPPLAKRARRGQPREGGARGSLEEATAAAGSVWQARVEASHLGAAISVPSRLDSDPWHLIVCFHLSRGSLCCPWREFETLNPSHGTKICAAPVGACGVGSPLVRAPNAIRGRRRPTDCWLTRRCKSWRPSSSSRASSPARPS